MSAHRLEVAVHVGSFTNLELLRKGLFRVRVRAFVQDPGTQPASSYIAGVVVASQAAPRRLFSRARLITNCEGSTAGVEAAYIDDDSATFSTRSVYCRYIEEAFDVNEVAVFKVVLPPERPSATDRLYVEAQLLRADFGPASGAPADAPPSTRTSAYEVVSTRLLDVGLAANHHLHAYFPVVWDSMNLALAELTVRAATVAALFEPPPRLGPVDALFLDTVLLPKLLSQGAGGAAAAMPALVAPSASTVVAAAALGRGVVAGGASGAGAPPALPRRNGGGLGIGDKLKGWVASALAGSPSVSAPATVSGSGAALALPQPLPRTDRPPPAPPSSGAPKSMEVRAASSAPAPATSSAAGSAASSDAEDATISMTLAAFTGGGLGGSSSSAYRGHAAPEKLLPRREVARLSLPYSVAEAAFPRWRAAQARERYHTRLAEYLRAGGLIGASAGGGGGGDAQAQTQPFPLSPAELQRAHIAVVRPLVDTYLGLAVVADECARLAAAAEGSRHESTLASFHAPAPAASLDNERFCEYVLELCDAMLGVRAGSVSGATPSSASPRLAVGLGIGVEAAAPPGASAASAVAGTAAGHGSHVPLPSRLAALLAEVACHARYQRDGKAGLATGPGAGRAKAADSKEDGKEGGGKGDSEDEEVLPTGHAPVLAAAAPVTAAAGPASPGGSGGAGAAKSPSSNSSLPSTTSTSGSSGSLSTPGSLAALHSDGTGAVDGFGVAYRGRSGGASASRALDVTNPTALDESFAARVRAASDCPEAVGVALANEAEHVSGAIYGVWRRLMKLALGSPAAVPLPPAAAYRAAVLASLRSAMTQTTSLPSALYDPRSKPLPEPPLGHRATWARAAGRVRGVRLDPVYGGLSNDLSIHEHRYTALLDGEDDTGAIGAAGGAGSASKGGSKGKSSSKKAEGPAASASSSRGTRIGSEARFSDDDDGGGSSSDGSGGEEGGPSPGGGGAASRNLLAPPAAATPAPAAPLRASDSSGSLSSAAVAPGLLPSPDTLRPLSASRKVHVVIFMNGLGGSVHDTRIMRAYCKALHPHLVCHALTGNQGKASEGDIIATAARLAQETHDFLTTRLAEDGAQLERLSFVAFSLGGVIARLMLRHPLLVTFRSYYHAFVTVASPHLGLLYAKSALLNAGVYLFRAVKGSQAMAQLSFTDEKPPPTPTNGGGSSGEGSPYPTVSAGGVGIRRCLLYLLACGWQPPPAALQRQPTLAAAASTSGAAGPALPPTAGARPTGAAAVAALAAAAAGASSGQPSASASDTGGSTRMHPLRVNTATRRILSAEEEEGGGGEGGEESGGGSNEPLTGRAALQAVLASSSRRGSTSSTSSPAPGTAASSDRVPLLGLYESASLPDVESRAVARRSSASAPPTRMAGPSAVSSGVEGVAAASHAPPSAGADVAAGLEAAPEAAPGTSPFPPSDPASSSRTLAALASHRFTWQPNGAVLAPFRHVVLVASQQDAYAPATSCFAQWGDAALGDPRNGPAWGEMVRGFFTGLPSVSVLRRWEVAFQSLGGGMSVDAMLGREAHIAFLENEHFGAALAAGLQDVWDPRT